MKPEVKVFTRQQPCTKADIWQCFWVNGRFATVQVDQAHAIIGKNVPRVMERNGYLINKTTARDDSYYLTPEGQSWLRKGIESYVKNHPNADINLAPAKAAGRVRRIRQ